MKDLNIKIRQEAESDHDAVFALTQSAFSDMPKSNNDEHFLVQRLRRSSAFIPELSLVAIDKEKVVGHILLTKILIRNNKQQTVSALTLAPVSVLPKYHRKGIGSALINQAHLIAKDLGYGSVVLLGHASYYPRFGYRKCSDFEITLPFDSPDENCMVIELYDDSLKGVSGEVVYPKEFFS